MHVHIKKNSYEQDYLIGQSKKLINKGLPRNLISLNIPKPTHPHISVHGRFPLENDETYHRMMISLNPYLDKTSSKDDKELPLEMVKETYLKHSLAIKTKSGNHTKLMLSTIMYLFVDQNIEIERLINIKNLCHFWHLQPF